MAMPRLAAACNCLLQHIETIGLWFRHESNEPEARKLLQMDDITRDVVWRSLWSKSGVGV